MSGIASGVPGMAASVPGVPSSSEVMQGDP